MRMLGRIAGLALLAGGCASHQQLPDLRPSADARELNVVNKTEWECVVHIVSLAEYEETPLPVGGSLEDLRFTLQPGESRRSDITAGTYLLSCHAPAIGQEYTRRWTTTDQKENEWPLVDVKGVRGN
jgi:hypothetical protein